MFPLPIHLLGQFHFMGNSIPTINSNRNLDINLRVEGMSLDFLALNICGFVFYAIYSTIGYFHLTQGAGTVVLADLLFAYHALAMVLLWLVQTYIYPHGKNRLSRRAIYICEALWGLVAIQVLLTSIRNRFLNISLDYALDNIH